LSTEGTLCGDLAFAESADTAALWFQPRQLVLVGAGAQRRIIDEACCALEYTPDNGAEVALIEPAPVNNYNGRQHGVA